MIGSKPVPVVRRAKISFKAKKQEYIRLYPFYYFSFYKIT